MTTAAYWDVDPALDLVVERYIDLPPSKLWAGWTQPDLLKQWFCPKPWGVSLCEIDLLPGGKFRTIMSGPEGESFDGTGCYLELVPERRLVWTSAMLPGFRPAGKSASCPAEEDHSMPFTAIVTFTPEGNGTRYRALVRHLDEDGCQRHAAMGFHEGWGAALDQLIELAHSL